MEYSEYIMCGSREGGGGGARGPEKSQKYRVSLPSADPEGGTGGPDPPPWKITSYMGFQRGSNIFQGGGGVQLFPCGWGGGGSINHLKSVK